MKVVIPGFPAIDISATMFDHIDTQAELSAEYARVRRIIPQWHEDGRTRGILGTAHANRSDAIRNRS